MAKRLAVPGLRQSLPVNQNLLRKNTNNPQHGLHGNKSANLLQTENTSPELPQSWKSRETVIAIFTVVMIAVHLLSRFVIVSSESVWNIPL
jgi:hypothetical protein